MKQKSEIKKRALSVSFIDRLFVKENLLTLTLIILAITFFSFSPVLKNGFLNWDDNAYVFENPLLNTKLSKAIPYFFGPHYFIGNYIPVTMTIFALEYHAAGLSPFVFHLLNLLLHLANVLLVFWFIYLLSGKKPLVAALVSLFFGIHPMHVESVAWVSELKDVLYSLFFVAGLISYYKYLETKPGKLKDQRPASAENKQRPLTLLLQVLLFFLLSLLSKPAAIVFPFILMLLDFYTFRKFDKWAWLEKIPLIFVSIIFGVIALKAQEADRLLQNHYSFFQRLFFASHSFLNYLLKLFLPINQSIFYPYPKMENEQLPVFYYMTPALVAILFFFCFRSLKRSRLYMFGMLFFSVNLLLVLQFVSVGYAIMADRYTYIPYVGLLFVIAMEVEKFYNHKSSEFNQRRSVTGSIVLLLIVICSYSTFARSKVWKNDDDMATDLLEKFPEDALALNNKGFILFNQGNYQESIKLLEKAVQKRQRLFQGLY